MKLSKSYSRISLKEIASILQLDNAEELYSQHIIEGEDTNNPIHVAAQEKLKWSNGISETDAQTHIDALKTEMTQYSDEKIQEK